MHVLSAPPAFVLSQDQTLKFSTNPKIGSKSRHPTHHTGHKQNHRNLRFSPQKTKTSPAYTKDASNDSLTAACTSFINPTMSKNKSQRAQTKKARTQTSQHQSIKGAAHHLPAAAKRTYTNIQTPSKRKIQGRYAASVAHGVYLEI